MKIPPPHKSQVNPLSKDPKLQRRDDGTMGMNKILFRPETALNVLLTLLFTKLEENGERPCKRRENRRDKIIFNVVVFFNIVHTRVVLVSR